MSFWKWCIWILVGALMSDCKCDDAQNGEKSQWIRKSVVAGKFYPADAGKLRQAIKAFFGDAVVSGKFDSAMAVVSPHAGYIFSGQIAADAYSAVGNRKVDTVVILGTNHRAPGFDDFAIWPRGVFQTPLGDAIIDEELSKLLLNAKAGCVIHDAAHLQEHSVEVQIPFIQVRFPGARIVPVVVGTVNPEKCRRFGEALAHIVTGRQVLIVASSDFSHYPEYEHAKNADLQVLSAIASMDPLKVKRTIEQLERSRIPGLDTCACGQGPILAAMYAAKKLGAQKAFQLSYANSGDLIIGEKDRVVGYGAVVFAKAMMSADPKIAPKDPTVLSEDEKKKLLTLARDTIERYLKTDTVPLVRGFSGASMAHRGVFVTLKKNGELRGCIGHMAEDMALCKCVSAMALQAAFGDRRFPNVRLSEMPAIEIEISVLTPMTRVRGPEEFIVGRDGIQIRQGSRSAVFLPQVATEQGWTREETLNHLCRKAGLPTGAWRNNTEFYTFQAEAFAEH